MYPTPEQEHKFIQHNDAKRAFWNYLIALQEARHNVRHVGVMSAYTMAKEIKLLKMQDEFKWLNDISARMLNRVCADLEESYDLFFRKIHRYPKYKSKKKDEIRFPIDYRGTATYFADNLYVQIPKVGRVKYKTNYKVPVGIGNDLYNARISYIKSSKKWILSFALKCESQAVKLNEEHMGIDLGIKELAVVAFGKQNLVFHNINKSKRMKVLEKKKKHIKKTIDRKYRVHNGTGTLSKGQTWEKSKHIEKYEQILREIETKMSNVRHNYIHQTTRILVNMLPEKVTMEDLKVKNMMKNRHVSKYIWEQNWSMFIECMKYKCEEYGIEFIQADRLYPSSKTCSGCGHVKKDLKLKDRTYICPICGLKIDRDYNAAINLMNYTEKCNR